MIMARGVFLSFFQKKGKHCENDESKEILLKETKKRLKKSKFYKNGNYDFENKFDEL